MTQDLAITRILDVITAMVVVVTIRDTHKTDRPTALVSTDNSLRPGKESRVSIQAHLLAPACNTALLLKRQFQRRFRMLLLWKYVKYSFPGYKPQLQKEAYHFARLDVPRAPYED